MSATKLTALFVIGLLGSAHADDELTMQDLVALDKAKQWTELLDRAERVKPAARTADWTKLVTAAATHVVEQIDRASSSGLREAAAMVEVVPAAERRYTFLLSDAHYLDGKAKLLDGVTGACIPRREVRMRRVRRGARERHHEVPAWHRAADRAARRR